MCRITLHNPLHLPVMAIVSWHTYLLWPLYPPHEMQGNIIEVFKVMVPWVSLKIIVMVPQDLLMHVVLDDAIIMLLEIIITGKMA